MTGGIFVVHVERTFQHLCAMPFRSLRGRPSEEFKDRQGAVAVDIGRVEPYANFFGTKCIAHVLWLQGQKFANIYLPVHILIVLGKEDGILLHLKDQLLAGTHIHLRR